MTLQPEKELQDGWMDRLDETRKKRVDSVALMDSEAGSFGWEKRAQSEILKPRMSEVSK